MKKFEYRFEMLPHNIPLSDSLNQLGQMGWEVVNFDSRLHTVKEMVKDQEALGVSVVTTVILKREIPQDDTETPC